VCEHLVGGSLRLGWCGDGQVDRCSALSPDVREKVNHRLTGRLLRESRHGSLLLKDEAFAVRGRIGRQAES
jgi:hypothetical protein